MPELPEVETIRIGLQRLIIGLTISNVKIKNQKSFIVDKISLTNFLVDKKVINIKRRAKILMIDLESKYSLVFHLKMTGQLVFVNQKTRFAAGHPNDSLINKLPDKSTRVIFTFSNGARLYFNDQRKFGWIKLLPTNILNDENFFSHHGPEPLTISFNENELKKQLMNHPNRQIKAVLLDQSSIAGLGNIYVDESLWLAELHPQSLVKSLKNEDFARLYNSIRIVLNKSIKLGGSTDKNYVNAEGQKGSYLQFANVFRKNGQPCPRCGSVILKQKISGRGTHFCPNCQKVKK